MSAGSRHTSNDPARLMKLCGVMELCQKVRYTGDVAEWVVNMMSGDVVAAQVKSLFAEECSASVSQKDGRSDRGEVEGNCLQVDGR